MMERTKPPKKKAKQYGAFTALWLKEETDEALCKMAKETHTFKSALIRKAITEYIEKNRIKK